MIEKNLVLQFELSDEVNATHKLAFKKLLKFRYMTP